jgi:ATP-binding cassette subfamily B (MDR/TAP) protein 1
MSFSLEGTSDNLLGFFTRSHAASISKARSSANEVVNMLDSKPHIDAESDEGKRMDDCKGHLKFENVQFRYPTRPET